MPYSQDGLPVHGPRIEPAQRAPAPDRPAQQAPRQPAASADGYPPRGRRNLITASVMTASMMNSLDTTIANVALPHVQGAVSAAADQITWVLTSYIVAAAIMTPMAGWLAGRFGRKRLMLVSLAGFVAASALCGISTGLYELVIFRIFQGAFGAALVPMSQAILLDINPPERHGPAMAIWGMGAVLGPIIGPALGGWLTQNYDWRWVFLINIPIGIAAFAGMVMFMNDSRATAPTRLDLVGFALISLVLASLQLMLDRGQQLDWFASTEICIEAGLAVLFLYLFVVHMLTARRPFIAPALFTDPNFVATSVVGFMLGVSVFSVLALLPPMLENLMGYPVMLTGLVTAPRGLGTMVSMLVVGRVIGKVDPRWLIGMGLVLISLSMWMMSGFALTMNASPVLTSAIVSGVGSGLIFVPLSTVAFATLDPALRNEGAAMFTLFRNLGSAAGISVIQFLTIRNGAIAHSRLTEGMRPDNPALLVAAPDVDFSSPASLLGMNGEITRQAGMVAYIDSFHALFVVTLLFLPLLFLIRKSTRSGAADIPIHLD